MGKLTKAQKEKREIQAKELIREKMQQIRLWADDDKQRASQFGTALTALSQNNNLSECSVESILNVGFDIVQIGLNPNPLYGQAYVVPYVIKTKAGSFTVAQLQIGYKGYIATAYKNGWLCRAVAVYMCDGYSSEFGGLKDVIHFTPNYEERNDDDSAWVYNNLKGVLVYAKDSHNNEYTEFISFRKLEKIRLKSPNQKEGSVQYIWEEWTEEMYKAKAIKYVLSRLPINEKVYESIAKEDIVDTTVIPSPTSTTSTAPTNPLTMSKEQDIISPEIEENISLETLKDFYRATDDKGKEHFLKCTAGADFSTLTQTQINDFWKKLNA